MDRGQKALYVDVLDSIDNVLFILENTGKSREHIISNKRWKKKTKKKKFKVDENSSRLR